MSLPAATVTATANPWLRILGALEKKITRHSYDTWLKPTRFSHTNGNIIFVRVPETPRLASTNRYFDPVPGAIAADLADLGANITEAGRFDAFTRGFLGTRSLQEAGGRIIASLSIASSSVSASVPAGSRRRMSLRRPSSSSMVKPCTNDQERAIAAA